MLIQWGLPRGAVVLAAPLLLLLLGGAGNDSGPARWLGTCSCDSDRPEFSCHGQWPVWGDSEAHLERQCSERTNGSGSVLDAKSVRDEADPIEASGVPPATRRE